MTTMLEKLLKQSGFHMFTTRDFMSMMRGGHNFVQIRFDEDSIVSHCERLDSIFDINVWDVALHQNELATDGYIIKLLALSLGETARARLRPA